MTTTDPALAGTEALSYELRANGPPATSGWSNRLLPRRVSAALAHRLMTEALLG